VKSSFEEHSAYRQYVGQKVRFTPAAVLVPQAYERMDAPLGATTPFLGWRTLAAWRGKSSDGMYDCLVSLYMAPDIDAVVTGTAGGGFGVGWCRRRCGQLGAGCAGGVVVVATWVRWRAAPSAEQGSRGVNARWARHQWVGQAHSQEEYRALADTLRRAEISDVLIKRGAAGPGGRNILPDRYVTVLRLDGKLQRPTRPAVETRPRPSPCPRTFA
jgi:hypothetical protein